MSHLAQRFSSVTCLNQPGARWETGTKYEELVPSIYRCNKIFLAVKPRRIHKNVLRPGGNSHMKGAGMLVGNENNKTPKGKQCGRGQTFFDPLKKTILSFDYTNRVNKTN